MTVGTYGPKIADGIDMTCTECRDLRQVMNVDESIHLRPILVRQRHSADYTIRTVMFDASCTYNRITLISIYEARRVAVNIARLPELLQHRR